MRILIGAIRAALLAATLAAAAPAAAQTTLSPSQMRQLAAQAVMQGQPGLAYDLSGALVARDGADLDAHLVRSRAARDLGRNDAARHHAQRAWDLARTPEARYAAAMARAQALSSSGRRTAAQLWLRRAVQIAPSDSAKARAAQDFRYVRSRNPWATHLSFSVAPSSNINNGSRNETSELFALPFEFQLQGTARALSGLEIAMGADLRYRLRRTDRLRSDLELGLDHRTYVLSDEARDIAPDADGGDFATSTLSLGLRETYRLADDRSQLGWNAALGTTWYGGERLFRFSRVGLSYRRLTAARGVIDLGLTREGQSGEGTREDAVIWSGRVGYGMALAGGDRLSASLGLSRSTSDASYLDYTRRSLSVSYDKARPVGPVELEFDLALSQKHHDRSPHSADGRQERSVSASMTMLLPEMDYFGFVPTVTLKAKRTASNIDLYEADEYGLSLGIRSAF